MCHSRRSALWLHHVLRVRHAPNWPHPLLMATPLGRGGAGHANNRRSIAHMGAWLCQQAGRCSHRPHPSCTAANREATTLADSQWSCSALSRDQFKTRDSSTRRQRPFVCPRMVLGKQGMGIPYVGLGTPKMGIGTPKYPYMGTRRLQYGVTTSDIGTGTPRMSLYGGRKTPIWGQGSLTWAQGPLIWGQGPPKYPCMDA